MRLALSILVVTAAAGCGPQPTTPDSPEVPEASMSPADIQDATPFPFWARGPACCLDGWAGVSFYVTDPDDIPADFNFLGFFDPRGLAHTDWAVAGSAIFKTPTSPELINLKGLGAVPIWFFRPEEWAAMVADGVVTRPELEAHDPVKGHAHRFEELFAPITANSTQARHILVAGGTLDDGGIFRMNWINRLNENTGALTLVGNIDVMPD